MIANVLLRKVQKGGGARARGPPEYRTALASRPAPGRRGRRPRFQGARRRTAGAPTAMPAGALTQVGIRHHRNRPVAITRALGAYALHIDYFRRHTNFTRQAPRTPTPSSRLARVSAPPRAPRETSAAATVTPAPPAPSGPTTPPIEIPSSVRNANLSLAAPASSTKCRALGGRGKCEVSPETALLEGPASTLTTSIVGCDGGPPLTRPTPTRSQGPCIFFASAHPRPYARKAPAHAPRRPRPAPPPGSGAAVVATPRSSRPTDRRSSTAVVVAPRSSRPADRRSRTAAVVATTRSSRAGRHPRHATPDPSERRPRGAG